MNAQPPDVMDGLAKVADAVLFEGYLLYPYRASAGKNQLRWQFGVLTGQDWARRNQENWYAHTECLLEPGPDTVLRVRPRFLRLRRRQVQRAEPHGFVDVPELTVAGQLHLSWDEAIPEAVEAAVPLAELRDNEVIVPVQLPADSSTEWLTDAQGRTVARVRRQSWPIHAQVTLSAEPVPGPYGALRLRLRVSNASSDSACSTRDTALRSSLIGAHTILALTDGTFLSLTDPPEWAGPAARACRNEHTWPVLAGSPQRPRLMLCSPIILADFPEIAPESPNELFDGTENDEILTLRTLVLTDAEKREARATDPRAAALVDAVDSMPPEILERLHGVIRSMSVPSASAASAFAPPPRSPDAVPTYSMDTGGQPWWDPAADASVDPETDTVLIKGHPVAKGSRVLLCPGGRADAQDLFLTGRQARVEAVLTDVDGEMHLAVSLVDDPAAEFQAVHGRFRYFRPDEVQVLR